MPATLDLRAWALTPELGRNLGLHASLDWALATEQRISMWGPYQVDRDLYERALRQIALLESGRVSYKMIDTGFPVDCVSNCIHGISSVAGDWRLQGLSPGYGETASFYLARRFEPWIIDPCRKHKWVSDRMGLGAYSIVERDW
jgi:hypothetical protein